jgi:hypothetical protein
MRETYVKRLRISWRHIFPVKVEERRRKNVSREVREKEVGVSADGGGDSRLRVGPRSQASRELSSQIRVRSYVALTGGSRRMKREHDLSSLF